MYTTGANYFRAIVATSVLSLSGCAKIWITHSDEVYGDMPAPVSQLEPETISPVVHSVTKRGETLSGIARRYTGAASNWRKLEAANPKLNAHRLRIGDRITIPGELVVASAQPASRAALKESLPPAATKISKPAPGALAKGNKSAEKPKSAALPKAKRENVSVAKLPVAKKSIPVQPEVQREIPKPEPAKNELAAKSGGEMLSETTDLLPEFSSTTKPTLSEAASKERVKRGLARKANLASELIDPARLAKRPKPSRAAESVTIKPREDAPPEVASTFLTCRADRCNIRVASE